MRILIANSLYPTPLHPSVIGGAENSVRYLAEALVDAGHRVRAVRLHTPGCPETFEKVNGVEVYSVPIRNLYWFGDTAIHGKLTKLMWHGVDDWLNGARGLEKHLDDFTPDILHTNNLAGITTFLWRAAHKRSIPIIHTLRDYYLLCPRSMMFRKGCICSISCKDCQLLTIRRRGMTALVQCVVGNSSKTLDIHINEGLFANAICRVPIGNISSTGRSVPVSAPPEDRPLRFGFIGRISEEKGVKELVAAFATLNNFQCELIIAGRTRKGQMEQLKSLAGGARISFLGFVDPGVFYSQVDVVVVPSLWHEPLARAILDSFAFGRPVIGSIFGGTLEALQGEAAGWLFSPDKPGDLAKTLQRVLDERALIPEKSAAALVQSRQYEAKTIVTAYEAVYRNAIEAVANFG